MWLFLAFLQWSCDAGHDCTPDGPLPADQKATGEINGTCAPAGEAYVDHYSCEGVGGPCRGEATQGAVAHVDPDPVRLDDPDLPWVTAQLEACACSCCHNDTGESAHIWSWDFEPVWTDSVETARLERMADPEARDDIDPADNNGFSRAISGIPSTDGDRLLQFLERELDRR